MRDCGFTDTKYADDLTCTKEYDLDVDNGVLFDDMALCQTSVRQWGECKQVSFDASKEAFVSFHPKYGVGDDFKILGWNNTQEA